jgi:hypothetical protein
LIAGCPVHLARLLRLDFSVIARLRVGALAPPDDRLRQTIQCFETAVIDREAAAYWMPSGAGMTA